MTQQEADQMFQEKMYTYQSENNLPDEHLELLHNVLVFYRQALRHFTPAGLRMSPQDFVSSAEEKDSYTLHESGRIISVMETATPFQMELDLHDYAVVALSVAKLATAWQEIIKPQVVAINREIQVKHRIMTPGGTALKIPMGKA